MKWFQVKYEGVILNKAQANTSQKHYVTAAQPLDMLQIARVAPLLKFSISDDIIYQDSST